MYASENIRCYRSYGAYWNICCRCQKVGWTANDFKFFLFVKQMLELQTLLILVQLSEFASISLMQISVFGSMYRLELIYRTDLCHSCMICRQCVYLIDTISLLTVIEKWNDYQCKNRRLGRIQRRIRLKNTNNHILIIVI